MMRCPFAIRLDGPPEKTSGRLEATGVTLHSAEYDLPEDQQVLHNALFSDREASWHFTITKPPFAFIFQHYPIDVRTWHCGPGNPYTIGIEHEGIAPAKIEGVQYDLLVRLLKWIGSELWKDAPWHRANSLLEPCRPHCQGAIWQHQDWMSTLCAVFSNLQVDPVKLINDLKEEDMRPPLYRIEGRPEVYYLAGGKLIHIPDQATFIEAGYLVGDVEELPPRYKIWDLPVEYPRGVPDGLR